MQGLLTRYPSRAGFACAAYAVRSVRSMARVLSSAGLALLASCGGGGGETTRLRLHADPPALSLAHLERTSAARTADISIWLTKEGGPDPGPVYIAVQEDRGLIADARLSPGGGVLTVDLRTDLPVGSHSSSILLLMCVDEQCLRQYPGSPTRIALSYEVMPNFTGPEAIELERTGAQLLEPVEYPIGIPPRGNFDLELNLQPGSDALDVQFDGSKLRVSPKPVQAGSYSVNAKVFNRTWPDYSWTVPITYRVHPPEGGEKTLAVNLPAINETLLQGQSVVRRLSVTAPTWLPGQPTVRWSSDTPSWGSLSQVAPNEYDVTLSARNMFASCPGCRAQIWVDSGQYGGFIEIQVAMDVIPMLIADPPLFDILVTESSTPADLRRSAEIRAHEDRRLTWRATTASNRLRLLRSTGTTGVDRLEFEVDEPNVTPLIAGDTIAVAIDEDDGVLPLEIVVYTAREVVVAGVREAPTEGRHGSSAGELRVLGRMTAGSASLR